MWVADNSKEVLSCMRRVNAGKGAQNIGTYDFETLYTNIPHDELIRNLTRVISEAFDSRPKTPFLNIGTKARWGAKPSKKVFCVDKAKLIAMTEYLIENIYVTVGNKTFRQILGIPMGTDCAPFLANLFLYACEEKWLGEKKEEKDWESLKLFADTFRYIDDLVTFNNNGRLAEIFKEIYPPGLNLKKENLEDTRATFLDLRIKIVDGKFHVSLYDKRDDFPFHINSFPHLPANVSIRRAHDILTSQLVRYARICGSQGDFFKRTQMLTNRLIKQGFRYRLLAGRVDNFVTVHQNTLNFRPNKAGFVDKCFSVAS
jgi:hypothetical protein